MSRAKENGPSWRTGRGVWAAEGDLLSRSSGHAQDGLGPKDVAVVRMMVNAGESHGAQRNGATKVPSMRTSVRKVRGTLPPVPPVRAPICVRRAL